MYDCCGGPKETNQGFGAIMIWATANMMIQKLWEKIKSAPFWVWAVISWAFTFLVLKSAQRRYKKAKIKSDVERAQRKNLVQKTRHLAKVKKDLAEKLFEAEERHKTRKAEILKKGEELDSLSGDAEAITDAVNDSFGDGE